MIYQNAAIGRGLVNYQEHPGEGVIVEFPVFDEVSGSASPGEGTEPTAQTLNVTMPTATMAKRSVFVQLSGLAIKGAGSKIVSQIGATMGMAKAKQDDAQIFSIVTATTDFSSSVGATNTAMSITVALAGLLLIQQAEVAETINCVVDANGYNDIRTGLLPVANDDTITGALTDTVSINGLASRAYGMNWYVTERIGSGTVDATTEVTNGLIFVKSAIGYAHAWSPGNNGLEIDRIASSDVSNLILNYYDSAIVTKPTGIVKVAYV